VTLALAVLARAPLPFVGKTRLHAARPAVWIAELQRAMLEDTLARLGEVPAVHRSVFVAPLADRDARAAVRAFVPAEWEVAVQRGDDLGARLAHAMRELFATGAAWVAIAGSDCPHLPPFEVDVAEDADVLLGPSDDGGYYLVATCARDPRIFRGIEWSTPRVFEQTRARCAELGLAVRTLSPSYDVDEPADLERLAADLALGRAHAPRTARLLARG
jgi:uncharacterized protein